MLIWDSSSLKVISTVAFICYDQLSQCAFKFRNKDNRLKVLCKLLLFIAIFVVSIHCMLHTDACYKKTSHSWDMFDGSDRDENTWLDFLKLVWQPLGFSQFFLTLCFELSSLQPTLHSSPSQDGPTCKLLDIWHKVEAMLPWLMGRETSLLL